VVGVLLAEELHHPREVVLVALHLVVGRKAERNPFACQEILKPAADDLAQARLGGGDLQSDDLELAGDGLGAGRHRLVLDDLHQVGLLSDTGYQRE
jgi:hypothetical protein